MSHIVQGALFIADHAARPPPDVDVHAFNTSVIASHLGQHTYHLEVEAGLNSSNQEIVNVHTMRQVMERLCDEASDRLAYQRLRDEDAADAFIRVGSKGLSRAVLDSYDYNSETFRETVLPGFSDSTLSLENVHLPVWRSYWVAIQDIAQARPSSDLENHKYASRKYRTEALSTLIKRYGLTHNIESGRARKEWRLTSDVLERCLMAVWRRENAGGSSYPDADRLWTAGFEDWDAKFIEKIQVASGILHHRRQLPLYDVVGELAIETVSLPGDAASQVAAESVPKLDDEVPALDKKVSGHLMKTTVHHSTSPPPHRLPPSPSDPPADNTILLADNNGSVNTVLWKPTSSPSYSPPPSSVDLPAGDRLHSTRKRSGALDKVASNADDNIGALNVLETSDPALHPRGEKRKAVDQHDTSKRVASGAVRTPDTTNTATPLPGHIDQQQQQSKPHVPLQPQQQIHTTLSTGIHAPEGERMFTPLAQLEPILLSNAENHGRMESIYEGMRGATLALLFSIDCIDNMRSPFISNPPNSLEALYIRCWGPDWPAACKIIEAAKQLSTFEVTGALVAAFIHDRVLSRQVSMSPMCSIEESLLGFGAHGQAVLSELAGKETAIVKKTHHVLVHDENFINNVLNKDAEVLALELWEAILPYVRQISVQAKLLNEESCDDEKVWFEEFKGPIGRVIYKALILNLRLIAGDCEYEFFWPKDGDVFDSNSMQHTVGAYPDPRNDLEVLVTKFPGLRIEVEQHGQPLTLLPFGAVVRSQRIKVV